MYMWAILLFFGYDDILYYVRSPYMLIPLVLIAALYGILNSIGNFV